jgi:hypothetical protein
LTYANIENWDGKEEALNSSNGGRGHTKKCLSMSENKSE